MIVPDGMTIHGPGRKYKGGEEVPNDLLPTVKTAPTAEPRKPVKPASNEPA
jgi:hypothetical protein